MGDQLGLLRPASARGQKETKKEGLRRALQLHRAGVDLPTDSRLFKKRREVPSGDGDAMEEDSEDGDGDSDDEEAAPVAKPAAKQHHQKQNTKTSGDIRALGKWNDKPKAPSLGNTSSESSEDSESDSGSDDSDDGAPPKAKKAKISAATELRSAVDQAKAEIGDAAIHMDEDEELTNSLASKAAAAAAAAAAVPPHLRALPRVILVQRTPEIEAVRTNLPIVGMEQEIMESISENDVIVLCGETGCGKTTQVPQFLYEAGYGSSLFPERAGAIGVTQPRRVAAVSTARRVAEELDSKIGDLVGYQVRYDKKLSTKTCLKFMTDGILLREVQEDFLLRKYSVIIVDEAHERSLNTDILLGMLSRIVTLRRSMSDQQEKLQQQNGGASEKSTSLAGELGQVHPLKLIIMSATLRTEDFVGNAKLFSRPPPVVSVPARQYPVTVHFSRKTELDDYVGAAHKKVCQIHRNLPPGGVLVFLTGQREVEYLCQKLRKTFAPKKGRKEQQEQQWNKNKSGKFSSSGDDRLAGQKATQQREQEDGHQEDDDSDGGAVVGCEGDVGGSWSGAGEDAAEADAAAAVDEAFLLSALDDERSGAADRDDFDAAGSDEDEASGDEEEVVILGGEGFTAEQIAEAEERFDQQLRKNAASGQSLTSVAADAAKQIKNLKGSIGVNGEDDEEGPVHVLPLYAMLPPAQQARVFQAAPPGARLIIVATNVAETSLTIPGIRYVVDAGRSKQRLLENASGLARFEVRWVSKASAEQRAGRAGRTGPGHCYRLFSSAHYHDTFPQHTPPEIVNTALEGVALSLKALGVDKVANFPFPTAPEPALLSAAEQCLIALGALDPVSGRLTTMGVAMAKYPISPRHSRMLLEALRGADDENTTSNTAEELLASSSSHKKKEKKAKGAASVKKVTPEEVLRYAVGLAAVLSVESPFINLGSVGAEDDDKKGDEKRDNGGEAKSEQEKAQKAENDALKEVNKKTRESARLAHARLRVPESDALSALCALCAFEAAGESEAFCRTNHLLFKNLREAAALRKQLSRIVAAQRSSASSTIDTTSPPPAPPPQPVLDALRRAIAAGWGDHVARRVRSLEHVQSHHYNSSATKKNKRAVRYKSCTASLEEDIFLHPNSALHSSFPDLVVYSEIVRTVKRPYMAGLTTVEPRWLATAAAPMCNFSSPLLDPPPFYNVSVDTVLCWQDVTFGSFDWPLPRHAAPHPELAERCAVFAAAFLEGKIARKFADLKQYMAAPASMAAKPEMRVHRRVADLISALEKKQVDSRSSLAAVWKKDSQFLKKELEAWMQKGAAGKLESVWNDVIASITS